MSEALDINRRDVRHMAEQNHQPQEEWTGTYVDDVLATSNGIVTCKTCSQIWPCATRRALDEYANDLSQTYKKK